MNKIFKVIYSKVRNCYVVTSEFAKANTKSSTGSERNRTGRKALLTLAIAAGIFCGGLGVATAADGTVHVADIEATTTSKEVYTAGKVDTLLADYGKKSDVENNKNSITTMNTTITTQGQSIATNVANIANNTKDIEKKIDTEMANERFAAKVDLTALQNQVTGKVDKNTFEEALNQKADTDLGNLTEEGKTAIKNTISEDMDLKADKATTLEGYGITDAYTKDEVNTELGKKADQAALNQATDKITVNKTAITELTKKTTEISYADGGGTNISGVTIKDGNIVGNNSAITGLTKVETDSINGKSLADTNVATEKNVSDAVKGETDARTAADAALEGKINAEQSAREEADKKLSGRIGKVKDDGNYIKNSNTNSVSKNVRVLDVQVKVNEDAIAAEKAARKAADTALEGKINTNAGNIQANKDTIDATNKRTGGITRNDAASETTIEGHVTVDNLGNVKAKGNVTADGKLKGEGVDAGAGAITTTGAVNAGSLNVTDASHLKGDVTLGTPNGTNTVTVNGTANFNAAVNMDKGLTVTNGETKLKDTTVTGDLTVTGTITTDKMIFGDKANLNYTEIDKGHITSKNAALAGDATLKSSSMELDHSKLEVAVADKDSNGHLTMTANTTTIKNSDLTEKNYSEIVADKDSVTTTVRDEKNNTTSTKSSATKIRNYAGDAAGNKTINVQTATQNKSWAKDKDGNESSIVQTGKDITNTAEKGTITSKAKDIVNDASENISNKSQTMDTTVTGKATESYGSLDTTVNGNETHIVKGTKTETVEGKVTETYKNGQETNVTGNQDIHVTKNQTNKIDGDQVNIIGGSQTTTATDINRNASSSMVDKVNNAYGTNTETKEAGKTTTDVSIKGTGEKGQYIRGANESRDYLIKGTLKNSETKTAEKTSTEITDGTNKASTMQDAKNLAGSVTHGTETGVSGIHANDDGSVSIDSAVAGGSMSSVINQKKDSIQSAVGDGTNSTVIHQDKDNVTIASSNGMVAIVGKDIVNNAQDTITNTAGTSITNQVKDSKVTTDANGTTFENNTAAVSDGGTTTTQINGNRITTGRVDANELGVSDWDGANTANLSVKAGEGVKASAGNGTTTGSLDVTAEEVGSTVKDADGKGSTFKQRIDAIMMESKNVSIKAEETLTNEAKVITNKASEVINNEAVNINNTATGIITSKASEIQNQADKLISNKVGENTWENMENGKITTSIKDGAKQNLTQSDAAGTTQSTVDGGKSTVTIQNADGLTHAVNNGTSINASATTATSSAQTILSGGKANSVITTIDGTQFVNSDAAAPVGDGTADRTTIKGNTITTGKVTMDYADVMRDLGVHGSATVDNDLTVKGITTTKTLNVTENATVGGTLEVTQKATFRDDVDIKKNLSVDGNATIVGDVTASSYKVGNNTYIDANGINANNQKVTNVADGAIAAGSTDAVNGGQLFETNRRIDQFDSRINEVGANAAAMANLHPMEFDADSKLNVAVGVGNYRNKTATAMGLFYRPNEDVMFNVSSTIGSSDNMIGGGVSFRLGSGGNKLKNKAFADAAEQNKQLKSQVDTLQAQMDALLSVINPNMSKDFPDVPDNHWAYEAVSRLAGNDIIQGYEDGKYHGERTMTRYEMAVIIYKALQKGIKAEAKLVEEFKPELKAIAAHEKA